MAESVAERSKLDQTLDESSMRTMASLLGRIKDVDDQVSWSFFYKRYHSLVRAMAWSFVRTRNLRFNEQDIEDIVIEVMVGVSRQIGEFEYQPGKRKFRGYLSTMTRRRCIDLLRRKVARPGYDPPLKCEDGDRPPDKKARGSGSSASDDEQDVRGESVREKVESVGIDSAFQRMLVDDTDAVGEAADDQGMPETEGLDGEFEDLAGDEYDRPGTHDATPGETGEKLQRDFRKDAKKMELAYGEFFAERTGEFSRLFEQHDMEVGGILALEKLRHHPRVTTPQYQIFEQLARGVPVATVCAQLGVTANQVHITRSRVRPHYEQALLQAKEELDGPKSFPSLLP